MREKMIYDKPQLSVIRFKINNTIAGNSPTDDGDVVDYLTNPSLGEQKDLGFDL